MSRILKTSMIALAGLVTLVPPASARHVVIVRPYYYRPYHLYPGWYHPWWGPTYIPIHDTGHVKIVTQLKDARVYVDGGYAGLAAKLKKIPLSPGNHNIELRDSSGHTFFQERVHIILGKTTKIRADHLG